MSIDDILMHDETIFRDIRVFNPDYVPDKFLHRENQTDALTLCLRPALKGGKPINAIVVGSCATGKTTAIKKIFERVEEYSDRIVCVYINCQLHTTRYNIFSQIYQKIFGHLPPETGIPVTRIYEKIMKHLKKNNQALVVALDDVNYLFHSKNANKIFYDILRAYEEFEGVRTGLFAVISDIEFRYILDKNVKSVFIPQEVIFDPYTYGEMRDILQERVKAGFYPDVISDEILDEVTENTSSIGDLRVGIELLGVLGNLAEADASRAIEDKHLKTAIQNTSSISLKNTLQNLQGKEKKLLELIVISEDEQLTAGNLYKNLNNVEPLSYASFDRLLNKLEFLRLIDVKFTGKGRKGNSRIIFLRFDSEEIGKCII
ncbi:MAG: ORC1-type DNA replication protein [Methanobacterium sp.]|jgi:cell division control protein 6|nr:ORC1-type DNA replication protein [Methanobacterium sp.]